MERLQLKPNWKLTVFSVLLLPVLLSLGFWQLSRAQEKQTLQQSWLNEQAKPAIHYRDRLQADVGVRRAYAEGTFTSSQYWLIENKQQDGMLGYHVVMPFKTVRGDWLLVNRGWVKAGIYREDNPSMVSLVGNMRITGTLKNPSDSVFIEHENNERVHSWPYRLLEVDIALMSKQFGEPFAPTLLLLDADSPGALLVDWQPINMTPQKHQGYAVQWFTMAFVLLVLWVATNTNILTFAKQIDKDND